MGKSKRSGNLIYMIMHHDSWQLLGSVLGIEKEISISGKRGSAVRKGLCETGGLFMCEEWSHLNTFLSNENIKWERTLVYDQWSVIILQMSRHWVSASIVRINKLNNNQLRCVSFVARGSFREDHIKRNCSQKFTKNETLGEEGRERDNFGLMPWRTLHLLLMALLTL